MNDDHETALTQRAALLIDQNRYEDAAALLNDALSANPEDSFALYLLALCQLHIPKNEAKALATISQALSLDSMNASFFALRSSIYHAIDKNKQALADADQAIAIEPENDYGHVARGSALMGMEKWAEAERSFREALRIDPDNIHAGNLLAVTLRHQNRSGETREHIGSLLAKNPNDSFSHANAGWAALERHDLGKAKSHFLESLRLDPESEYARRGIIETFKAKSPAYRAYLAYCFKMAKLTPQARIGIIIGLFIAVKIIQKSFTGNLTIIGTIAVFVYLLFAMWSWVANGVGNLFLLMNGFARHALKKEEKIEALLVGGNVLTGLALCAVAWGFGVHSLFFIGPALIGAAFPFSIAFNNRHPAGKPLYTGLGCVIMGLGILSTLFATIPFTRFHPGASAIIIAVAVTWIGAFGFLRK
jgi:tetratricopeptide (TPR) repeat protein